MISPAGLPCVSPTERGEPDYPTPLADLVNSLPKGVALYGVSYGLNPPRISAHQRLLDEISADAADYRFVQHVCAMAELSASYWDEDLEYYCPRRTIEDVAPYVPSDDPQPHRGTGI